VAQGKCVKIEKDGALVTIEEYDTQFSKSILTDARRADLSLRFFQGGSGVPAAVGDILRIAFKVKGNERTAVKVMNVSKQDLMKK